MKTNIDLDEELIRRAARLTSLKTKREIVHQGLELLVKLKEQERIRRYRGKLRWRGDLNAGRKSKVRGRVSVTLHKGGVMIPTSLGPGARAGSLARRPRRR